MSNASGSNASGSNTLSRSANGCGAYIGVRGIGCTTCCTTRTGTWRGTPGTGTGAGAGAGADSVNPRSSKRLRPERAFIPTLIGAGGPDGCLGGGGGDGACISLLLT